MDVIAITGIFLGILIFLFTFTISKKIGKFYLAPVVTAVVAAFVIFYSIFKIRGFEGMAYGFLGASILVVAVIGSLVVPFMKKRVEHKEFNKRDKAILIVAPVLLFALIVWTIGSNDNYWVIEEGHVTVGENSTNSYYSVSTILEGKKQLHIQLGDAYEGKHLLVKDVKTVGHTEVILHIEDGGEAGEIPFMRIGLDEIVEPFVVKTTDGEIIQP